MKSFFLKYAAVAALFAASCPGVRAQVGDDNPTGAAGGFNGNITTGGSYDPYTGNATRSIADIVVPGAVGAYPLAFTRTMNTRPITSTYAGVYSFGKAGGWRHSYQWEILRQFRSYDTQCEQDEPGSFQLIYPDGRVIEFKADSQHPGYYTSPASGIGDRLLSAIDYNAPTSYCYLFLSDGGVVTFTVTISPGSCNCTSCNTVGQDASSPDIIDFDVTKITDPYGQVTSIDRDGLVETISEPAHRSLTLVSRVLTAADTAEGHIGDTVLDRVEERATPESDAHRTVTYRYTSYPPESSNGITTLTSVEYYNDDTLTAYYTYQDSNKSSLNATPLIGTCYDTMYDGPMRTINYEFAQGIGAAYGQIQKEHSLSDANQLNTVSTLQVTDATHRTELRGDGPSRNFTFQGGYLTSWTDFAGNPFSQTRNPTTKFIDSFTNARGYTTNMSRDSITGNLLSVTHPATPSDGGRKTVQYGYAPGDHYYVTSVTDENGHTTSFTRDSAQRVTDISYPDADFYYAGTQSHEGFHYNSLGLVDRHQRKNGSYEHFEYDSSGRGLLIRSWNPVSYSTLPTGSEPKTTISYYPLGHPWQDRVQSITDARDNTTTYEYERGSNGEPILNRGLLSKIIFPGTKSRSFVYDAYGNRIRTVNELGQPTDYSYDDFKRLTAVKAPRPNPANPALQNTTPGQEWDVTSYDYTPAQGGYYSLTAPVATTITSPTTVVTTRSYDPNLRLHYETHQNPGGVAATTEYHYDAVGNPDYVIDPRVLKTTFAYDERNRKTSSTSPNVTLRDGVTTTQYTTQWFYDGVSNVTKIILPDTKELNREYDPVNRLWKSYDQMTRLTKYAYWPSGMLRDVIDANSHKTSFEYDMRDLKTKMTYPDGTSTVEGWQYDGNGNMTKRPTADPTTVAGNERLTQVFAFDERNRLKTMRWNNGIDFADFSYDDASRLKSAVNPYAAVTRNYDVAGRLIEDEQKLATIPNTPAMTVSPTSVVSRQTHGGAGDFDVLLPLSGTTGVESRIGGASHSYQLVLTFQLPVTMVGARITSGSGTLLGASANANQVTVNLTNVANAQLITVQVYGLNDANGTGEVTIPMRVLWCDTTASGEVNNGDSQQMRNYSGQTTNTTNFRCDVNSDGAVNSGDAFLIQSRSGTAVTVPPLSAADVAVKYDYNGAGQATRLHADSAGYDRGYLYDNMGRLSTVSTGPTGENFSYGYDASSNVISRGGFRGAAVYYGIDEINRVTQTVVGALVWDNGQPTTYYPLHEFYSYDRTSRGTLTERWRTSSLNSAVEKTADSSGYNDAGELTGAQYGLVPDAQGNFVSPTRTVSYNLDAVGNRTGNMGVMETGGPGSGSYGYGEPNNPLNQYSTANSVAVGNNLQHQITSYDQVDYGYLGDGQLATVRKGTDACHFGHDAFGRLVRRTLNGVPSYYIYSGAKPIIELDNSGAVTTRNTYGQGVDEILLREAGMLFYQQDRQGNVSLVTNGAGQVVEQYRYDAFGMPEFHGGPVTGTPGGALQTQTFSLQGNRFLFNGREWEGSFGFYNYRARAYNPALGRFMSEDPVGFAAGDTNLFRYCGGDPVNGTDPTGLIPDPAPWNSETGGVGGPMPGYFIYVSAPWKAGELLLTAGFDNSGPSLSLIALVGGSVGPLEGYVGTEYTLTPFAKDKTSKTPITIVGATVTGASVGGFQSNSQRGLYGGLTVPGTHIGIGLGTTVDMMGGGRFVENWASGQSGTTGAWATFGAPVGATSWGSQPPGSNYGQGAGPTAIPTYWGPSGGSGSGGGAFAFGGYGSGIGSNAGVSQGGLMGGFTGSPASYFGSGMSGFASGFGVYSGNAGANIGGGPKKKF